MRKAFVQSMLDIADQDERVLLLTADLGFMVLEPFRDRFPNRFFNVGVSEQNMISLATGLALQGFIPFVYSIATFAVLREYEFIRNGPIAHKLPVRIVGVGTGVDYAYDGLTHYALEDIALMRTLSSLRIIATADSAQTISALQSTWQLPGPTYYRLSKNDLLSVPKLQGRFTYQEIELLRTGKDCVLLTTGSVSQDVYSAVEKLARQGVDCALAIISTIAPFDTRQLLYLLSGYKHVFTFEPHLPTGGVGSLVAEVIADNNLKCTLTRTGITYHPGDYLGTQALIHERNGLDVNGIISTVKKSLS
ncbi:MAG TPA: transketolase C-terminal domain-containing protein [Patescibacteria group bacterium]|nr:transketolase C-terminal domain-containing protein [Patescibacteria group bacterium]